MSGDPIPVLHDDEDLLVVSKPAGMLVHRDDRGPFEHVLLNTLGRQTGRHLYPVHRLDRNTSGVLCFAGSAEMARALQARLAAPVAVKEYLALARGLTPPHFESDRPLTGRSGAPRPARSTFARVTSYALPEHGACSLLRVRLHSGRYHQIRRHLNHLAHHVIGDTTHGKGAVNRYFRAQYGLPRMFLHAHRLGFAHPRTAVWIEVVDPLPSDLRDVLDRLPGAGSPGAGPLRTIGP